MPANKRPGEIHDARQPRRTRISLCGACGVGPRNARYSRRTSDRADPNRAVMWRASIRAGAVLPDSLFQQIVGVARRKALELPYQATGEPAEVAGQARDPVWNIGQFDRGEGE